MSRGGITPPPPDAEVADECSLEQGEKGLHNSQYRDSAYDDHCPYVQIAARLGPAKFQKLSPSTQKYVGTYHEDEYRK
jgi:hypothetical protein